VTVICIKDGVVVADGSSWQGGFMTQRDAQKIVRSRDGAIGAACGCASDTAAFRAWFTETSAADQRVPRSAGPLSKLDEKSGFQALWLDPSGDAWMLDWNGDAYCVGREPQATGGSAMVALGAMYAGASAEEAVRICIERHDCAGGDVFVERLAPVEPAESGEQQPVSETKEWATLEKHNRGTKLVAAWREEMGLA